jgi:uncharacterized protein
MKLLTPQEIEVWYILPSIRKELAKIMVEKGLTQKQVAKKLHLTEPAISQYLKDKRAKDVSFNQKVHAELRKTVETLMKNDHPQALIFELQRILKVVKTEQILCIVHKKLDSSIPADCNQCSKWW